MQRIVRVGWNGLALIAMFVILGGNAPAFAKSKSKSLQPSPASHAEQVPAPARFFTIKQVLERIDAGRRSTEPSTRNSDVQYASLTSPEFQRDDDLESSSLHGTEPFGLLTFRAPDGAVWRKWRNLEAEIALEKAEIDNCIASEDDCSLGAKQFVRIVAMVKSREGLARLAEANRNINASVRYISDFAHYSQLDHWAAPLATLAAGRGDCEDYAIAKYMLLRHAGVDAEDMRLLLVRDRIARDDHAVLAVRHDGRWLLLDNRHARLEVDTAYRHYTPVFALGHEGVKLFTAPLADGSGQGRIVPEPEPAMPAERQASDTGAGSSFASIVPSTPLLM